MENQHDSNPAQEETGSPLLAVLFIGQLITILAIAGVGWLVQNETASLRAEIQAIANRPAGAPQRAPEPQEPQVFEEWESIIRSHNVARGPEDAAVTIIEFSDFQCPFCSRFFEQTLKPMLQEYEGKIRFVYKNLPLTQIHPAAFPAAIALQCAHRDDKDKAWALHDTMFANFRDLSTDSIKSMGAEVGLGGGWQECVNSEATKAEVEQDSDDAVRAGARGTPAFLINGKFLSGAQPLPNFKREIDAILNN